MPNQILHLSQVIPAEPVYDNTVHYYIQHSKAFQRGVTRDPIHGEVVNLEPNDNRFILKYLNLKLMP